MSRLNDKKSIILVYLLIAVFGLTFCYLSFFSADASNNFVKILPSSVSAYSAETGGAEIVDFKWQNPKNALTQDLSEKVSFEDFNETNSAFITSSGITKAVTPPGDGVNYFLDFSGFDLPEQVESKEIKNVQLRFSLAASQSTRIDANTETNLHERILIEYQSNSGLPAGEVSWQQAGEIILDKDISNILNGGYFLYALPVFQSWEDFNNLKIRFTFSDHLSELSEVNLASCSSVYLDAVWIEVEYGEDVAETTPADVSSIEKAASLIGESIMNSLFDNEESIEEDKKVLERDYILRLVSEKKSFKLGEKPSFKFQYKKKGEDGVSSLDGVDIKVDLPGLDIDPLIYYQENGEFLVDLPEFPRQFRPGKYILRFEIENGGSIFIEEQEFVWGVLAINTNKSIYLPSETAYLQMAVLKDDGHTICDASLKLEITSPKGTVSYPEVKKSGKCAADNVTDVPDYFSYYQVSEIGTYEINLLNLDNGYQISDSFEVRQSVPFEVERIGPTRIYPPADYEMAFKIKANQDFIGEVEETVPNGFEVQSQEFKSESVSQDSKTISWDVDWKTGETYQSKYTFNAPDISPYLYYLGPLKIGEFQEERLWQIASDATTTGIVRPDGDTATAAWTPEPTGSHYSTIDDDVTYPTNGITTDYVDNGGSSGNNDQYTMGTITEAGTTTAIEIFIYGNCTKANSVMTVNIYYDGSVQHYNSVTLQTSYGWATTSVTGLSLNQTSLASLEIYISGNAGGRTYTVATLYAKITYEIANQAPSVANISLNGGTTISLVESVTTSVQAVASTTDENGQSDITSVIGRIFRSGVTSSESCTLDDNNCYEDLTCVTSSCTGAATSCHATCSFDVWYYAEPTDGTVSQPDETPWSAEHWVAWIKAIDSSNASSSATNSSETVDVGSLLALDVSPPIDYGELSPEQKNDPLDKTTTITNTGNCSLDLTLYGLDMTSGGDTIVVGKQKYATSSETYALSTSLLVSPGAELELDLPKTTASSSPATDDVWWGIEIPAGQSFGTYSGTTTFEAKKNEVGAW